MKRIRSAFKLIATPTGIIGFVICAGILLMAVLGPFLVSQRPEAIDLGAALRPPSAEHLFGTDAVGRDILSRLVHGSRYTLTAAVSVILVSLAFGTLVGTVAGYASGWVGNILMRVTDLFLSYPALLLAISVGAALGRGLVQAAIALAVVNWAGFARIAYVQTVTVRHRQFMEAAEISGTSHRRRLFGHLVPNVIPPLLVKAAMDVAFAVEWIAALGFIGLGAAEPTPEWGAMIASSRQYALTAWWYVLFPSVMLLLTMVGFVFLGGAIEERTAGRGQLRASALRKWSVEHLTVQELRQDTAPVSETKVQP